jgi:DNA-binding MarR family transcriptional regulator
MHPNQLKKGQELGMTDDLFKIILDRNADRALTRNTDPKTSHAAAASVNVNKKETIVLQALFYYGPMTSEETATKVNMELAGITPRFRPLANKNLITEETNPYTNIIRTRPGKSGKGRIVWKLTAKGRIKGCEPKIICTR